MRYAIAVFGLAAVSTVATAQEAASPAPASAWQFFEEAGGSSGALVKAEDGNQLVLKCDKPGSREVYAILMSPNDKLAAPADRPISRPIRFQFDDGGPRTESWGFFPQYAVALGKSPDRSLPRFVSGLRGASNVKMRLDTGISQDVEMSFDVAGAKEAITQVYTACQDKEPS